MATGNAYGQTGQYAWEIHYDNVSLVLTAKCVGPTDAAQAQDGLLMHGITEFILTTGKSYRVAWTQPGEQEPADAVGAIVIGSGLQTFNNIHLKTASVTAHGQTYLRFDMGGDAWGPVSTPLTTLEQQLV